MYYSPTIVQLAGIASNRTALLLSLVTAGLNAIGSVVSMYFVDRTGRKKLLVFSLIGIILSLGFLSAVFHESTSHAPAVSASESSHFPGLVCPNYGVLSESPPTWNCMKCLKASPSCGFCAQAQNKVIKLFSFYKTLYPITRILSTIIVVFFAVVSRGVSDIK